MQHGSDIGGLSGVWTLGGNADGGMRQQESQESAERDPMHTDKPAGGAQKGRTRPIGEAKVGSAMICRARAHNGPSILDVAAHGTKVAVSLSDSSVRIYTAAERSLLYFDSIKFDTPAFTAVTTSSERNSVVAVAADGVREIAALGSGPPVMYADPQGTEVFCAAVSPDGELMAVGGEGRLLLFDTSTQQLVAAFEDTHKEAVSQVVWVPGQQATLISASDDGLVAVFDLAEGLDEDDSWRAALNLDGAVAKMGFYGAANAKLWMASQLAGLHLWEWQAACSEDGPGGEGTLADFQDARGPLADAVKAVAAANGHSAAADADDERSSPPQSLDFLLSCTYDAAEDRLLLAAGHSGGSVAIFPVYEPSDSQAAGFGPPVAWLTGVHTEGVRGLTWLENPRGSVVTGAEDGLLCLWAPDVATKPTNEDAGHKHQKKRRKGV